MKSSPELLLHRVQVFFQIAMQESADKAEASRHWVSLGDADTSPENLGTRACAMQHKDYDHLLLGRDAVDTKVDDMDSDDDSDSKAVSIKSSGSSLRSCGSVVKYNGSVYTVGKTILKEGKDVVVGGGRGGRTNNVNSWLSKLINSKYRHLFESSSTSAEKKRVLASIYKMVLHNDGHFYGSDGASVTKKDAMTYIRKQIVGTRRSRREPTTGAAVVNVKTGKKKKKKSTLHSSSQENIICTNIPINVDEQHLGCNDDELKPLAADDDSHLNGEMLVSQFASSWISTDAATEKEDNDDETLCEMYIQDPDYAQMLDRLTLGRPMNGIGSTIHEKWPCH